MINNNECDKYEKLKIKTKDTKNYLKCERVRKEKKNSNILIFVYDKGTSIYRKPNNKTMCQEEILKTVTRFASEVVSQETPELLSSD